MDINQQLKSLTEETLNFAQLIDHNNSDNLELLHACELFSRYLDHQLQNIDQALHNKASLKQLNTFQHLHRLHRLITPATNLHKKTAPWKSQLDDFLLEAKVLKQQAA